MKHFCSVPVDLKIVEGAPKYDSCGENAVCKVKNSDWYICEDHVAYANNHGWELEKLE